MDLKLQGRVVAITGGASGIGRSCALRYLEEGCLVAVCGRNRAKLEVFRRQCREAGHEVLCVEADVADTEALERFADTAVSHFGRLDVWYNNAGMGIYKPLMDVSLEEWDGLMGINLRGVFAGSRLAAERMQQGGVIVNASSFAARDARGRERGVCRIQVGRGGADPRAGGGTGGTRHPGFRLHAGHDRNGADPGAH